MLSQPQPARPQVRILLMLLSLLLLPAPLVGQQGLPPGSGPEGSAPDGVEGYRLSAGLSAAAVRFSGEVWPRAGVWVEGRVLPGVSVWGEAWGVRRATLLCPGSASHALCDDTSDGVGWMAGARLHRALGPGEGWAGLGVGRNRYDGPAGASRSTGTHLATGYRLNLGERLFLSPRVGTDIFVGESDLGGWFHFGMEAGVRF